MLIAITSASEVMFLSLFVCRFVCSVNRIAQITSGRHEHFGTGISGDKKSSIKSWDDPDVGFFSYFLALQNALPVGTYMLIFVTHLHRPTK